MQGSGVEWSVMQWSGVLCSGVDGVECCAVEWKENSDKRNDSVIFFFQVLNSTFYKSARSMASHISI